MSSKKSNKIILADPTLRLSKFKLFQMRLSNKKEAFSLFKKTNVNFLFYKDMASDIFVYSLASSIIMIPFSPTPIIMGLSIGTGLWLYITRIHDKLKEVLGSVTLVNSVRYGK